jgi:hypothetical protein
LVVAGVDLYTVKEILGHKTLVMTQRYAHLSPEHQRQAVERLVRRETARPSPIASERRLRAILACRARPCFAGRASRV